MTTIAEHPGGPLARPAAHGEDGNPAECACMEVSSRPDAGRNPGKWLALVCFTSLALLMYVSIMLKIMKFGP